jgi:hypothetical protein
MLKKIVTLVSAVLCISLLATSTVSAEVITGLSGIHTICDTNAYKYGDRNNSIDSCNTTYGDVVLNLQKGLELAGYEYKTYASSDFFGNKDLIIVVHLLEDNGYYSIQPLRCCVNLVNKEYDSSKIFTPV